LNKQQNNGKGVVNMRLTGFSSGMDLNQMVTDLMKAERMPMDRMKQDQQQMEWKMDQYREINIKLDQFRTSIFDSIMRRSNMMAKSASSSNEQLIKATASAAAGEGTFRISEVKSLATAATNASTAKISGETKIDPTKKLNTQNFSGGFSWGESTSITTYNDKGEQITTEFTFTGEETLNEVIKQMNDSDAGINVFYDEFSDMLSVSRKQTGNFNPTVNGPEMQFSGAFFTDGLKLNDTAEKGGTNAQFTINGLETHRQSNTFTMNGVTMTLQGTFDAGTNSVTIGTTTNVDKVMDTITKFVEEYNELVDMVNGKTGEEFYRDYRPLTSDEKNAMSDREVEQWEEKAMSGLLRNDRTLQSGFSTFRTDMYSPVQGMDSAALNQIAQIGITTTNNFRDGGKLEINEDKLRAAIEKDPEAVFQLFAADGPTHADKGLARRVRASADGLIDRLSNTAGGLRGKNLNHQFTLGRQMDNLEDRISNFERRMQQVEARYWSQFNAMEKALAQSNAQADSLFAQLNSFS